VSKERTGSTDFLPVLSAGKHRSPRKGACVMEYASFLAGEKWSDHPACTHPLLAELARQVNDFTHDGRRQALAELVPELIGRTGSDLRIDLRIALRAAQTALPVVAEERQRIMAVALLTSERLSGELDGTGSSLSPESLSPQSRAALASAPQAEAWARGFTRHLGSSPRTFRRQTAPTIVRLAVQGIACACVPDPDGMLHELLVGAIADCPREVAASRRPTAGQPAITPTRTTVT